MHLRRMGAAKQPSNGYANDYALKLGKQEPICLHQSSSRGPHGAFNATIIYVSLVEDTEYIFDCLSAF